MNLSLLVNLYRRSCDLLAKMSESILAFLSVSGVLSLIPFVLEGDIWEGWGWGLSLQKVTMLGAST